MNMNDAITIGRIIDEHVFRIKRHARATKKYREPLIPLKYLLSL